MVQQGIPGEHCLLAPSAAQSGSAALCRPGACLVSTTSFLLYSGSHSGCPMPLLVAGFAAQSAGQRTQLNATLVKHDQFHQAALPMQVAGRHWGCKQALDVGRPSACIVSARASLLKCKLSGQAGMFSVRRLAGPCCCHEASAHMANAVQAGQAPTLSASWYPSSSVFCRVAVTVGLAAAAEVYCRFLG